MTEFKLEPIQQVIIHELIHDDLENFLHVCYMSGSISAIWVDGIIIRLIPLDSVQVSSEQSIKNLKYYDKLIFAKYPKYAKSVKWNGANYELVLKNFKNYPRFVELAKWIKSQPVWNTTPDKIALPTNGDDTE